MVRKIVGYKITGSFVKGSKGLLFRTKKEAKNFTKRVGGIVKIVRK